MKTTKIDKLVMYAERFMKQAQQQGQPYPMFGGRDMPQASTEELEDFLMKAQTKSKPWQTQQIAQQLAQQYAQFIQQLAQQNAQFTQQPLQQQVAQKQVQFPTIPKETQEALNALGYKGKDGKPLVIDGKLGPNTQFALDQYRAKNKNRIEQLPAGLRDGDALFLMIQRDASGENKTEAFDHKLVNDELNKVESFLKQLELWKLQNAINDKNVSTIQQMLKQWHDFLSQHHDYIRRAIADTRSTEQEKQLARSLLQKSTKLFNDLNEFKNYLDKVSRTPSTTKTPGPFDTL
jgi:hypothetical protein